MESEQVDSREGEVEGGPTGAPRWWLHGLLLLATLGTTTAFGVTFAGDRLDAPGWWADPAVWSQGLAYSLSIMAILLAHELGHYITARRYGVDVTPPFFLPGFPPFGTFGAFIKMRMERPVTASQLFRIGAGGPYAGFVLALPLLMIGLALSEVQPLPEELAGAQLGDSLLMMGLVRAFFGVIPQGQDVFLHPMAYAGWVGMFVTSFNLVPLGQLDGGHIAYTLFGERFNKVAWGLYGALVVLGLLVFQGWLVLALFLFFMGPKHPPVVEGRVALKGVDRWAGFGALALLVLTFTPRPFNVSIMDVLSGM